ncbi:MAG: hypothetical protein LUD39_05575 [Opitutae bacterium]|nr:hypothetical protein [Opitutae bacterium]MCD8299209.1 hypothetical protein [Opitutae bacterium]
MFVATTDPSSRNNLMPPPTHCHHQPCGNKGKRSSSGHGGRAFVVATVATVAIVAELFLG